METLQTLSLVDDSIRLIYIVCSNCIHFRIATYTDFPKNDILTEASSK